MVRYKSQKQEKRTQCSGVSMKLQVLTGGWGELVLTQGQQGGSGSLERQGRFEKGKSFVRRHLNVQYINSLLEGQMLIWTEEGQQTYCTQDGAGQEKDLQRRVMILMKQIRSNKTKLYKFRGCLCFIM